MGGLQTITIGGISLEKCGLRLTARVVDTLDARCSSLGVTSQHGDFGARRGQSLGQSASQNASCANYHRYVFRKIKQVHSVWVIVAERERGQKQIFAR